MRIKLWAASHRPRCFIGVYRWCVRPPGKSTCALEMREKGGGLSPQNRFFYNVSRFGGMKKHDMFAAFQPDKFVPSYNRSKYGNCFGKVCEEFPFEASEFSCTIFEVLARRFQRNKFQITNEFVVIYNVQCKSNDRNK